MKTRICPLAFLVVAALSAAAADAATGWVLTGDYSQFGRLRSFDQSSPWGASGDLAVTPGDAVGREHGGLLYVVGRGGASVLQIYDPAAGMSLVREFSLGVGRNPQDIAFDSQGRAFVSCYDQAVLLRIDVEAGIVAQTYSTAAFADSDGLPETSWMLVRGDRLFITCHKLDRTTWRTSGPGTVLVFDLATDQWLDTNPAAPGLQPIMLAGGNPFTRLEAVGVDGTERLRVGCVGDYGLLDGGVAQIDPATLTSQGFVVTESQLGGDIGSFVSTAPTDIYAVVSDVATYNTNFVRWQGGSGSALVRPGAGFVFADLAWDGDCQLFLADRTLGADGLRIYDACSGLPLGSSPIATGLPPSSFVLPADPIASPSPLPAPLLAGLSLAPPYPNPCNPSARLEVDGPADAEIQVRAVDLAGRVVGTWNVRLGSDGGGVVTFDGRGPDGRALPAGQYLLQASGPSGSATRSVTLLK